MADDNCMISSSRLNIKFAQIVSYILHNIIRDIINIINYSVYLYTREYPNRLYSFDTENVDCQVWSNSLANQSCN